MSKKDELKIRTKICNMWQNICSKHHTCDFCTLKFNSNDEDNWCSLRTLLSKYDREFDKKDFE